MWSCGCLLACLLACCPVVHLLILHNCCGFCCIGSLSAACRLQGLSIFISHLETPAGTLASPFGDYTSVLPLGLWPVLLHMLPVCVLPGLLADIAVRVRWTRPTGPVGGMRLAVELISLELAEAPVERSEQVDVGGGAAAGRGCGCGRAVEPFEEGARGCFCSWGCAPDEGQLPWREQPSGSCRLVQRGSCCEWHHPLWGAGASGLNHGGCDTFGSLCRSAQHSH